jgi:transposase
MSKYDLRVAFGFRPVDRDQQFLLPPDMREWLPADHPVWLLIEAVRLLDTSAFQARCRIGGVGRAGYDPDMLLTLLLYGYARGVRSSRRIERLCWEDVGFRVICAQDVPDHSTIWRFTDADPEMVQQLFTEVLVLCAKAGMGRLETITLDGMKIGANGSKNANRSEEQIRAELGRIAAEAVAEHRHTDEAEDALFGAARGDELPGQLADPRRRESRLRRAAAELEAERRTAQADREAQAEQYLARRSQGPVIGAVPAAAQVRAARQRLERAVAAQLAKIDDWERRNAEKIARTGMGLQGPAPQPVEEHFRVIRARAALAKAEAAQANRDRKAEQAAPPVRNVTDPDSRLMPTKAGFIQGFNAQNVVSEDHLILATELTQDTGDVEQAVPMMRAAEQAADLITKVHSEQAHAAGQDCTGESGTDEPHNHDGDPPATSTRPACPVHPTGIGTMVMDAGYLSEDNLTTDGPDRLIATGKRRNVEKGRPHHHTRPSKAQPRLARTDTHPPNPIVQMTNRLRTPDGIATYRRRGHIAETPHGHIKHNLGIRALSRRGLGRAAGEWKLICAAFNLDRLLRTLARTGQGLPSIQ